MNHALPHTSANLQGKTVIVTGATQGLGTDIAKVLVAEGAVRLDRAETELKLLRSK